MNRVRFFWCLAICSLVFAGCAKQRNASLHQELLSAFQQSNPRISYAHLLELRPNPASEPGSEYLLLATAGAPNLTDSIDFKNELFGVFVADSSLAHLKRVLDVFPSKRWHDYSLSFESTPDGDLEVFGSGVALGDEATHRVYDWSPSAGPRALIREYMSAKDSFGTNAD